MGYRIMNEVFLNDRKYSKGMTKPIQKTDKYRRGLSIRRMRIQQYLTGLSHMRKRRRIKTLEHSFFEGKQETAKIKDQLLRTLAEFDNYRKRTEREFQSLIFTAGASLVKELLPVVDDLNRSLTVTNNHQDPAQFQKGIQLIYDKFMKILEARGVQPIDAVGQPFDTEKHEALMQVEKADYPSNTIVEVYEKGFMMHDKVLRHAKVIVNK